MRRLFVRTLLTLVPVAGLAAGGLPPEIVWQGALPLPMTAAPAPSPPADVPAPLPPATGGPALLAADAAPPLQERAIPGASSPLVTGALVDLQEAPARADNPFGLGAGLRHYFGTDETSALPYIGLDAGVQQRSEPPALTGSPFSTPVWQPQIGLRAGVTYPVSSGFALGIASGIYYQSEALSPDPAAEQDAITPYENGNEGLLVPVSVRGLLRF